MMGFPFKWVKWPKLLQNAFVSIELYAAETAERYIRRRVGNSDPEAFLAELSRSHPGKRYQPIDKYRDFRRVFLADEQGKRVLFEILSWGGIYKPSALRGNFETNETFFHDGERNVALRIMTTMNYEPRAQPTSTKGK